MPKKKVKKSAYKGVQWKVAQGGYWRAELRVPATGVRPKAKTVCAEFNERYKGEDGEKNAAHMVDALCIHHDIKRDLVWGKENVQTLQYVQELKQRDTDKAAEEGKAAPPYNGEGHPTEEQMNAMSHVDLAKVR